MRAHFLASPQGYVDVIDFIIQFNTGDSKVCHNITIIDDQLCEEPNEEFLSNLALVSGMQPIDVIRTPATIIINDTTEPECSK